MVDGTAAHRDVLVCAIGGSAGAVAALQEAFGQLRPDLGLAYVVVVHLPLDQPSLLHEILADCTPMPVAQVTDNAEIEADHVYVIASGSELVFDGPTLRARPFDMAKSPRLPVDTLFRSLARERGDGLAVILSGAGQDGGGGARAVKEAGGIVLVQDPQEAEYASMPQSIVDGAFADFVGPIASLVARIADIARDRREIQVVKDDAARDSIRRILALTQTCTGYDFSGYKSATIFRRIKRRMQLSRHTDLESYAEHVRDDPAESQALFADLLISVTAFFRDAAAFEALQRTVVRPIVDAAGDELRVWVVGCASGEEAYSVAMLFAEAVAERDRKPTVQVFATDLDEEALTSARAGVYPRSIAADVSPERLRRFFVDESSHYTVRTELRDMVLFAKHSVLREPPFTRLDLVVCRNVMIYFERPLQQQVGAIFHYTLQPRGYLFLGPAEAPDASSGLFDTVDREHRLYRAGARVTATLPVFSKSYAGLDIVRANKPNAVSRRASVGELLGEAHLAALESSAPPSVLVDGARRILNLSANAGRFMLMPGGPPADGLPAVIRPELRGEVLMALDGVFSGETPVVTRAVAVVLDGERRKVVVHAALIPAAEGLAERALICFLDGGLSVETAGGESAKSPQQEEILRLRVDLGAAQQALLTSRAENESSVQDLRVANEELHSLNEEYRSTAEELETSKEELQSVNEELQTVNAELRSKVQAISRAHSDLMNLTSSSEIGTLFLAADLTIRMFTPPITRLFKVSGIDVGRSITDFAHQLVYSDLERDVREVLHSLDPIEREIRGSIGRWLLLRIRPYRTTEDRVNGVVVTFTDVTTRKQELAQAENEARFRTFVTASFDVVYRMSADWREMLRLEGREVLATTSQPSLDWMETYILREDRNHIQALVDAAIRDKSVFEAEHRVLRLDGTPGWTRSRAVPILDEAGEIAEWLGTAVDITARRAERDAL